MTALLIVELIIIVALIIHRRKTEESKPQEEPISNSLPVKGAYQKRWLLTYNEKDAYKALKAICDENKLHLMTKVRLLDLVEPVKGNPKYRSYFYKIQAKHIDFVICDEKLVARCVIELDDNSHNQPDRAERDQFVNEVLESVGYKVLHIKAVTEETKSAILAAIPQK